MSGISFLHLLTLVFVVAKLAGAVAWSWWLVFLPSILSAGLGLLLLAFAVLAEGAGRR